MAVSMASLAHAQLAVKAAADPQRLAGYARALEAAVGVKGPGELALVIQHRKS